MFSRTDLGYTLVGRRWEHRPELTELEGWSLDAVRTWCQRGLPIPARVLADYLGLSDRQVRHVVNHLIDRRHHGLPITPLPGVRGGYFVPDHPALRDLVAPAVAAQLGRAKTSAVKARDLGATVQELTQGVVQLTLDLGPEVRSQVAGALGTSPRRGPATQAQVRQALARYARDPQRFAAEIAELRQIFGALFVRREDLARVLRQHSEALMEQALASLGGAA